MNYLSASLVNERENLTLLQGLCVSNKRVSGVSVVHMSVCVGRRRQRLSCVMRVCKRCV